MRVHLLTAGALSLLLAACASQAPGVKSAPPRLTERPAASAKGNDVVIFALGLIDTDYRFGGKNPEAGLDCSGMVSRTSIMGRPVCG
jgi:cell wall-associated NlpC family hydrolase